VLPQIVTFGSCVRVETRRSADPSTDQICAEVSAFGRSDRVDSRQGTTCRLGGYRVPGARRRSPRRGTASSSRLRICIARLHLLGILFLDRMFEQELLLLQRFGLIVRSVAFNLVLDPQPFGFPFLKPAVLVGLPVDRQVDRRRRSLSLSQTLSGWVVDRESGNAAV
jgi:hypothetical protein